VEKAIDDTALLEKEKVSGFNRELLLGKSTAVWLPTHHGGIKEIRH
jgi:hypothetical protein